ncbi:MAG: MGMT family protein [Patescibacteria group bacterium]|nr:MGMT family protein [Patescibacteria group bacterium]
MYNTKSFGQKVVEIVTKIPRGETLTYKQVAKLAGSPRAYRAVGNILNRQWQLANCQEQSAKCIIKSNDKLLAICHKLGCYRVIRSDSQFGGYAGGRKLKEKLLKEEKADL